LIEESYRQERTDRAKKGRSIGIGERIRIILIYFKLLTL